MTALNKVFTPLRTLTLLALLGLVPQLQGCVEMAVVGVGAAALASDDRRSLGAQTEDKEIDLRGESRINDRLGDKVHVNVTSYNRNVLLTGEAADAAAKTQIEDNGGQIPKGGR